MKRCLRLTAAALSMGIAAGCMSPSQLATANGKVASADLTGSNGAGFSPIGVTLETDRYFPLQRTFTWNYRVTIATPTASSSAEDETRITTLADSGGTRTAGYESRRTVDGSLTSLENGTMTETAAVLTIAGSGGSETIQLPLRAGANWTSGTLSARSFSVEQLKIGTKTYKDLIAISYEKNGETKAVRWFALGYGLVKQITRTLVNGDPVITTSELKSARLSAVTGVLLSPPSLTLSLGSTPATASAHVLYEDGSQDQELLYSVASASVATVSDAGVVSPVAAGQTVLQATSRQDPSKSATISVTVH